VIKALPSFYNACIADHSRESVYEFSSCQFCWSILKAKPKETPPTISRRRNTNDDYLRSVLYSKIGLGKQLGDAAAVMKYVEITEKI